MLTITLSHDNSETQSAAALHELICLEPRESAENEFWLKLSHQDIRARKLSKIGEDLFQGKNILV